MIGTLFISGSAADPPEKFDRIEIGDAAEDVERIIGKPDAIHWNYQPNNLSVVFHDGIATAVGMEAPDGINRLPVASGMTPDQVEAILGPPMETCHSYGHDLGRQGYVCFSRTARVVSKRIVEAPPPPKITIY